MEISELHSKVNDPRVAQLLDNILDAVLALKARLADSNMDSNSIGGIPVRLIAATMCRRFPQPFTNDTVAVHSGRLRLS
jgi:hypothetical protein